MTEINRLNQILLQLRGAVGRRSDRAANSKQGDAAAATGQSSASTNAGLRGIDDLRTQLKSGLVELDLSSARGKTRGRKLFIESLLLSELGVTVANDPRFLDLVERVERVIEQDSQLLSDMDQLLGELRG